MCETHFPIPRSSIDAWCKGADGYTLAGLGSRKCVLDGRFRDSLTFTWQREMYGCVQSVRLQKWFATYSHAAPYAASIHIIQGHTTATVTKLTQQAITTPLSWGTCGILNAYVVGMTKRYERWTPVLLHKASHKLAKFRHTKEGWKVVGFG